jgi:hypothetical protein
VIHCEVKLETVNQKKMIGPVESDLSRRSWLVQRLVVELVGLMEDVLWKMVDLVEGRCSS